MTAAPVIALFGNAGSPQVEALGSILTEMGATPRAFDIQLSAASGSRLTIDRERASWNGVDFGQVRATYIRCTAPNTLPLLTPVRNAIYHSELRTDYLREQSVSAATYAFFEQLKRLGALVVNPLTSAYLDHNAKAQLYQKLRAADLPVPRTLLTNDPDAAARFLDEVGAAVIKPQIGIASTRLVTDADRERLDELRWCPVMLQERVFGPTIRVHIVGDAVVLALRILSDDQIDSRTETRGFEYYRLPEIAEQQLVRANRLLGLHFAAWDVIVDDRGVCYGLDCNPGPYIMWIGAERVRIVFTELARYLLTYARGGTLQEASQAVRPWLSVDHDHRS